jgi:hypothetical protein
MAREEEATKGLVKRGYCRPKGSIPSHKRGCTTYACGGWKEDHDGGEWEVETKSGAIQRVSSFMKARNMELMTTMGKGVGQVHVLTSL